MGTFPGSHVEHPLQPGSPANAPVYRPPLGQDPAEPSSPAAAVQSEPPADPPDGQDPPLSALEPPAGEPPLSAQPEPPRPTLKPTGKRPPQKRRR